MVNALPTAFGETLALRPLPAASRRPTSPCRLQRPRHLLTEGMLVLSSLATASALLPEARPRIMRARKASRCELVAALLFWFNWRFLLFSQDYRSWRWHGPQNEPKRRYVKSFMGHHTSALHRLRTKSVGESAGTLRRPSASILLSVSIASRIGCAAGAALNRKASRKAGA